jgi:lipoprotein NlpD
MLKETLQSPSFKSVKQSLALLGMACLVTLIAACSTPKNTAPVRDYSTGRKIESSSSTAKTAPVQSSKTTTKADPIKSPTPKAAKEAPKEVPKDTSKELAKTEPKSEVKADPKPKAEAKSETKTEPKVEAKSDEVKKSTSSDSGLKLAKPASGQTIGNFDGNTNKGIDISGKAGDPIVAAADGKVVYAGDGMRGYGNIVIVKHDNNYLTVYAHNKSLVVKEGSTVKRGQKIAEMGNSESDRVKLHFELRRDGKPIDPTNYLQ